MELRGRVAGIGGLAVALLLLALWLGRPGPSAPDAPDEAAAAGAPARVTRRAPPAADAPAADAGADDLMARGAAGELGVGYRSRICKLCKSGQIDDPGCGKCPAEDGPYGRVTLDIVDEDGRPFPDHEASVHTDCGARGVLTSGHLDLPVGTCTLRPVRVDGLLDVRGIAVEVTVEEGVEQYLTVEIPSDPWGAVGVDLGDGLVVRRVIEGTQATEAIPVGAVLLEVDGDALDGLSVRDVAERLTGPVGSTTTVRFTDPVSGEEREVEIVRSRLSNTAVFPGMIPG